MGSFPYPRLVALQVILMIAGIRRALRYADRIVTSSPRTGFVNYQLRECLQLLAREYRPFSLNEILRAMPPSELHASELLLAIERLNDISLALIPFTEESCLMKVKQRVERALRELDEGLRNGEFDDDFDGGIVELLV